MITAQCALLGMDARTRHLYETFFRQFGKGRYRLARQPEAANVLLVDLDSPEGCEAAHRFVRAPEPGKEMIVLSSTSIQPGPLLCLHKPTKASQLRDMLERALGRLQLRHDDESAPRTPTGTPPAPVHFNNYLFGSDHPMIDPSTQRFDPQQHLYGALLRARQLAERSRQPVAVRWHLAPIVICPHSQSIVTGMSDGVMRSLARMQVQAECALLPEAEHGPADAAAEPLDQVLWRLAVWTSRGRLPTGCSPASRVRLKTRPNLDRLLSTPNALEIAALWSDATCSLAETARHLGIPAADVNLFFCAAQALALIDISDPQFDRQADSAPLPPPAPARCGTGPAGHGGGGFIARLIARLHAPQPQGHRA